MPYHVFWKNDIGYKYAFIMKRIIKHTSEVFRPGRLSAVIPLIVFIWTALQIQRLAAGERITASLPWVPGLKVNLALLLDGVSGLMVLIISGIGCLVIIYADAYMHGHRQIKRFYLYLHAFLLSMLGLVLSENLLVLFVFWELTTLFSFLLIGFEHESKSSRNSARQSLLVTGAGGLSLLAGILLIGQATGSYEFTDLQASASLLRRHTLYLPILICMLIGAFTKSAQFPFHFWLPNAMKAPTPISAFLHSATMVKAGIYLLIRLHPVLGGTDIWMTTLVMVGATTALWGSVLSVIQTDLKRILAYTTVMALGIITMFLGGRSTPALTAALTFLLVHALYKSSLFMAAGIIDHQTGTREIDTIGGIGRFMPFTALSTTMAALSMAGFPLFLGFIGKEIMYKGALSEDVFPGLATTAALLSNSLMTAVAGILTIRPFWGRVRSEKQITEASWPMLIGPMVLGGLCLLFGLMPDWVSRRLVGPAVSSFHLTAEDVKLTLFHGINEEFLLSMLTLGLGSMIYLGRRAVRRYISDLLSHLPATLSQSFEWLIDAILKCSKKQTQFLQSGSLLQYLLVITGTAILLVGWKLVTLDLFDFFRPFKLTLWQGLLIVTMLVSIGIVTTSRSRLLAICGLGVIGAGIAVIFLSFGAVDVGLTQVLVETLTLIIAAMVLLRLPSIKTRTPEGVGRRTLKIIVSLSGGLIVTVLLIAVSFQDVDRMITDFYEKSSYVKAHGRNIVNVILVDFRSLDTLGEIIVVAASALAGLALIMKGKETE